MRFLPSFLSLPASLLALTLATAGCHAQTPSATGVPGEPARGGGTGQQLTPAEQHRVEVLLRQKANLPPASTVHIGPRTTSDVPGFDAITVSFSAEGKDSKPAPFLISKDGKTLAQFSKYDLAADPRTMIAADARPSRGGPATAPVVIVGFDDLECPYCARMHAQLFPALTERYKDQVHIVYRDFPIDQHPWAMRAAIDTNCVGAQSATGYWNLVDYIHAHAAEMGGEEKSIAKANDMLDTLSRDEGKRQKVNADALNACITKQDDTAIKASMTLGESLGVDATPALFINGEKVEGAQPLEYVYRMIDNALTASGQTPPPPPPAPVHAPPQTPPATKPGN